MPAQNYSDNDAEKGQDSTSSMDEIVDQIIREIEEQIRNGELPELTEESLLAMDHYVFVHNPKDYPPDQVQTFEGMPVVLASLVLARLRKDIEEDRKQRKEAGSNGETK